MLTVVKVYLFSKQVSLAYSAFHGENKKHPLIVNTRVLMGLTASRKTRQNFSR